ncbi:hypothetical protein V6N12_061624 [Hibiscus sabdariffa]|uniref:Uncharacterized protein n=1 Tax=Hibiscus sabdariffa TaxID=183260 RepID=A0ABR2DXM0_9ROSI
MTNAPGCYDGLRFGSQETAESIETRDYTFLQATGKKPGVEKEKLGDFGVGDTFGLKELDFGQKGFLDTGTEQLRLGFDDLSDLGLGEPVLIEEREDGIWVFWGFEIDVLGEFQSGFRREPELVLEVRDGEMYRLVGRGL